MLPASNRGAGMNYGFPDTCLTPVGPAVVPIPYPNFANNAQAVAFSPNVFLCAQPALNLGSIIPMTYGDEPGVAHPTIKGASNFTAGNPKVFLNGLPAIDLTSPATGNSMNEGAGMQAFPSATNVFYTYATAADLSALDASLPRDGSAVTSTLLPGGAGLVRVARFSPDVPARAFVAIRRLEAAGARALVVDLRDNPGGELQAALQLASDFVGDGSLLLTMRDEAGDESELRARGGALYTTPLCLLVGPGTASAAELFAGCLQALGRAVVAGQRTYGKGVGHAVVRGADGALRTTRAIFTLPGGARVEGEGVAPDVALLLAEDAVADAAELLQDVR